MRRYFITGLLVWVPLGITIWVMGILIGTMDKSLLLLPAAYQPENLLGFYIPGLGVILTLVVVLLTGVLAGNLFGQQFLLFSERLLGRIPVVKSVYSGVKQVSDTLFSSSGNAFRKALLVQYPRPGVWTIAFQTGMPAGEIAHLLGAPYISVYVPTTPNPTSGFFLLMAKNDVIELEMPVDVALTYIISMGVLTPDQKLKTSSRILS